jgi:broad specificity phosphatase PhoE
MVQILGMRHGEKDDDKLTSLGEKQVLATGEKLKKQGFIFDKLVHSGKKRTEHSLRILAEVMELTNLPLERNDRFCYPSGKQFLPTVEDFRAEMEKIQQAGGSLDVALKTSEYARAVRRYIHGSIIDLAIDMRNKRQKFALVFSHSPLIATASPFPEKTPYGLYECDGILYTVAKGKIISFEIIRAAMPGKTLW